MEVLKHAKTKPLPIFDNRKHERDKKKLLKIKLPINSSRGFFMLGSSSSPGGGVVLWKYVSEC